MPKILIVCKAYISTVSSVVIKNMQALCAADAGAEFSFLPEEDVAFEDIASCDSLVCVRGSEAESVRIVKTAKGLGKFCVYFLDDDLLNIPSDIDAVTGHYYYSPEARKNIRTCIGLCDVLWSHNPYLLQLYAPLAHGHTVCTDMTSELRQAEKRESKTFNVLFAGSVTHKAMLDECILPAVKKLAKEYEKEITFTFIGPETGLEGENIRSLPYFENYEDYNRFLSSQTFHLGLAAVTDREFDRCKYFVKFFDYTKLGAAGLYSAVLPYTMVVKDGVNGFLTKNTAQAWYDAIKYAAKHREECARCAANAQKTMAERFAPAVTAAAMAAAMPQLLQPHGVDRRSVQYLRALYGFSPQDILQKPKNAGLKAKFSYCLEKTSLLWKIKGARALPYIFARAFEIVFGFPIRKWKTLVWMYRRYGSDGVRTALKNKLHRYPALFGLDKKATYAFLANTPAGHARRGLYIFGEQQKEMPAERQRQAVAAFPSRPLISVAMPLYNAPVKWLKIALASLQAQTYTDWQLCATDDGSKNKKGAAFLQKAARTDGRIRVRLNAINGGISKALNDCIAMAEGEYIALMDQDDELAPDALFWMAKEATEHPEADLIYSDECKKRASDGKLFDFYLKPDWSPELLLSHMYSSHLSVYRRRFLQGLGGFRSEFDLAQDYDLALRTAAAGASVRHVERILYFWRAIPTSGAAGGKDFARLACLRALKSYTDTFTKGAHILPLPLCNYPALPIDRSKKVSVIIPSDNYLDLKTCIEQLAAKTNYKNLQAVPVTNSAVAERLQGDNFGCELRICRYDKPFNFSDKCNEGGKAADGEYLVFYNDNVTPCRRDWLVRLLELLQIPGVGAVSPLLLQNDERHIQCAGMIAGTPGICGAAFNNADAKSPQQNTFHHLLIRNVSVLSGACFAIRRSVFLETLFDAENTPNGNSDVELSFRLADKGLRCVYNPYSVVVHIESHSRHPEDAKDKSGIFLLSRRGRFLGEDRFFTDAMKKQLFKDFRLPYKVHPPTAPLARAEKSRDVLFVTPELTRTGAPAALLGLVRRVIARGDFPVVTAAEDGPLRRELAAMGVTVIVDAEALNGRRRFSRFARNFDLVVANTLACSQAVGALGGDICPVLWWIHESRSDFIKSAKLLPPAIRENIHPYVAWDVINDTVEKFYNHRTFPVLPCCVAEPNMPDEPAADKGEEHSKLLLCVGSIESRKGQHLLAQALALLPERERTEPDVCFVGRVIEEEYAKRKVRAVLTQAKGARVRFLDPLPKAQLYALYARAYCVVVPSTDDPGPMIPVEAMAMQTPAIVSDACGASRFLHDGVNGILFRSGDAYQLSEKLRWALANAEELQRIGKEGRKVYEREFSTAVFSERADRILDEFLPRN